MVDIQYIADNSQGIILIGVVIYALYKTFSPFFIKTFVTRDELNTLNKDINHISQKADNYSINCKNDGISLASNLTEKMRLIQQETIEKSDSKYLSKEMDAQKTKQQEERFNKLECEVQHMRCTLEEVKTTGEVNATKLDNILDILSQS